MTIINIIIIIFDVLKIIKIFKRTTVLTKYGHTYLSALAQMVACLPLVQQIRGSIPGGLVNFHLKIFNLGARMDGDVHFLITRLYITGLD